MPDLVTPQLSQTFQLKILSLDLLDYDVIAVSHDKINVIFVFSRLNYPQYHTFQSKIFILVLFHYDVIAVLRDVARQINRIFEFSGLFYLRVVNFVWNQEILTSLTFPICPFRNVHLPASLVSKASARNSQDGVVSPQRHFIQTYSVITEAKHYAPNWFNCLIVCPFWEKSGKYYSEERGKLM